MQQGLVLCPTCVYQNSANQNNIPKRKPDKQTQNKAVKRGKTENKGA
jgi:uncharacterized Zn finger protein (UPF0148 family)